MTKKTIPRDIPANPNRRHLLAMCLPMAVVLPLFSAPLTKKKINEFGKVLDYLMDGHLRAKELGRRRISIDNADFSNSEIRGTSWQFIDFSGCKFGGMYYIRLEWLTDSTFIDCHFDGHFGLGHARDVKFVRCKVSGESSLVFFSRSKNIVLKDCEFSNSSADPNHMGGINSKSEITFIGCKARNFAWGGHKKLVLKDCVLDNCALDSASSAMFPDKREMPYSDFLIEDCDLTGGVEIVNAKLQSFTLRNSKVGVLETAGGVVLGDVWVEGIKEGHVDLSASDFRGKLTVRNCAFYRVFDGFSFRCAGDGPSHTLIENVISGQSPVDVIGAPKEMTEAEFLATARNKSFIIRNCKIPHLRADWAQTEYLRIENCELGNVYIRDGRIGRLEIVGTRLLKLDVSRTQVKTQDVQIREGGKISGHVTVTEGSNIKLLPRK